MYTSDRGHEQAISTTIQQRTGEISYLDQCPLSLSSLSSWMFPIHSLSSIHLPYPFVHCFQVLSCFSSSIDSPKKNPDTIKRNGYPCPWWGKWHLYCPQHSSISAGCHHLLNTTTVRVTRYSRSYCEVKGQTHGLSRSGPEISFQGLQHARTRADLIQFVFPQDVISNPALSLQHYILAPTNAQVDAYNSGILLTIQNSFVLLIP